MSTERVYTEDDHNEDDGGLGIADLISILMRRIRLIMGLTVLIGLAVTAFTLILPDRYRATATVQLESRIKRVVKIEGVLSDLKPSFPALESEVEIIKSRALAVRVIEQLGLRSDPEFATNKERSSTWLKDIRPSSIIDSVTGLTKSSPPTNDGEAQGRWPHATATANQIPDPASDTVATAFLRQLSVRRVGSTLMMEISFTSRDPVKAARIANAIAASYINSQIEAKDKASQHAKLLLDDKLTGLRAKLADAEREIERFKVENKLFDPDGRPIDASQLQREMALAETARTRAEEAGAKYEQARRMMLRSGNRESLSEVIESPTIAKLRASYFEAARREAELSTRYGNQHPAMEKVQAELAKIQRDLSEQMGKYIRTLKAEHDVALKKLSEQEQRLQLLRERVGASKDKQWRLRQLEREATASRTLYEAILSRAKQTEETVGLQLPDARLVTEADVPLAPAAPKRRIIILAGIGAGLALGIGLAFLLDLGTGGLLRPEDVERTLRTPHLASLPQLPAHRRQADRMTALRQMISRPRGPFAESIRALRFGLDSTNKLGNCRFILVTSAQSAEGKTLTAANLALHYALMGQRTLLVDADLRQMQLSADMGARTAPGLMDVMVGNLPIETAILRDRTTGMHLLPAAAASHSQPAPWDRQTLGSALQPLRMHYDIVIFDTAPLLPVADTRLMALLADQIVLVASWRTTPAQALRRAIKSLGPNVRKLCGVVLNRVDPGVHALHVGTYPSTGPKPQTQQPRSLKRAA